MDMLDAMLAWLPSLTDLVIYGAMASAAGAIYIISFMGIVGSFYRLAGVEAQAQRWLASGLRRRSDCGTRQRLHGALIELSELRPTLAHFAAAPAA